MRRIACCAIVFCLFAIFGTPALDWGQAPEAAVLVIEGGTLIDGNGGQPVSDSLIIVRGNKIETVSRKGQASYPAGAKVLQADGKFIIPGLMDAHVHYAYYMAELMLNNGVTSIFEIGGGGETGLAIREAINKGKIAGPRVFLAVGSIAGARIAEVGGRSPLEGPLTSRVVAQGADGARQVVKRFIDAGADMIKVHRGPTAEAYRAAAEEAHKVGLPVVAQPLGPTVYAREAVLAGADILEHSAGVEYSVAKDPSKWQGWGDIEAHSLSPVPYADMDEAKATELIQLMVQRNVALEPDFVCKGRGIFTSDEMKGKFELQDYRLLSDPAVAYIPERQRIKWLRNYVEFDDLPAAEQAQRRQGLRNMMRFIAQFAKAGGKVLAGTDTPGWAVAGLGLHHELEMMVEAGLTPRQVITAATRNTAEAFRILDRLGTVEAGKLADLVVLNANPLQDISNSQKIEWVIQDGQVIDRTYHPWFKPPLRASGVESLNWYSALKKQTMNQDPTWAFGWPPPGIEAISPRIVKEGEPALTLTIKGVNFVIKSLVYFDGQPVPTQMVSDSELRATIAARLIARPETHAITVKNPEPIQRREWGDGTSNTAHLLVNFRYE